VLGSNSKTVQYIEPNITIEPLFILADPRGTGTKEWFAVVTNNSRDQITAYAKSSGSAVSTYFTKSGESAPVPFNNIVTTLMTSMVQLFYDASQFNKNISDWDTSNVSSSSGMGQMFQNATVFNQDISKWNVANVKNMGQMFMYASKFNSDISGWNTSNVTDMHAMFYGATLFNQNLNGWNVGKVTTSDNRNNFASPALLANVAFQPNWPKLSRLSNGVTIQYTGTAQAVTDAYNLSTPSPLWIQEDPRGTGTLEWFAVVDNSSSAQITAYANSTDSAVSTYFTKSGESDPVPFNNIVTTLMTYMDFLLANTQFNKDISRWDTANVISMYGMFFNNGEFNQNISKWDVANVQIMGLLFMNSSKFNQDISSWNVAKVTNMTEMFRNATLFNQNLSGWNVGKVTSRAGFASPALLANVAFQPNWPKLSRLANEVTIQYTGTAQAVTDAYNLPTPSPLWIQEDPRGTGTPQWFAVVNNSSRQKIIDYARSTGSAVSAYFTKSGESAPVPFNNIVTTYMTDFSYILSSSAFNKPISDWDTSNVTNMSQMFQAASAFNQDISKWNVAKVTDMNFMFFDADFHQDISGWITSSVRNMAYMFSGALKFNSDISGWNTLNVENMQNMFSGATLFNRNLSGWNVAKVTNMQGMFDGATLFNQNLNGWNVAKVISRNNFASPALLANVALQPNWPKLSRLSNGVTIQYTGTAQAVTDAYNLSTPSPLWIQEDPRGTGTPEWFAVVNNSSRQKIIDYATSTGSAVSAYFTKSGESAPVDFNNIVTTLMTDMSGIFTHNYSFNKNISRWDTSNVETMSSMFNNATVFNQDISKWNTANVTNMIAMFPNARKFNQDIGSWVTSKVTNMYVMFQEAIVFNQNIGNWNTANVTNMNMTFRNAWAFNNGGSSQIGNWNTSNVEDMSYMFNSAYVFNQNIGSWDTANVKNMEAMFASASAFNQNLSGWNVGKVTQRAAFPNDSPLALPQNSTKLPPFTQ
jgi:surface protein